jgi:1-acyl-sn-glycerol-3-phosphate acyltransferase
LSLYAVIHDPTYILKRELMWIPFYGWYAWKTGLIPVDRSAGMAALSRMTRAATRELSRGRQIVIFPEGTRQAPGAPPDYKPGAVFLYSKADVPCVPMALNSGLYWPRRSTRRVPGTIIVEVLEPIPPGLDRKTFAPKLESVLEEATARLVAEGRRQIAASDGA